MEPMNHIAPICRIAWSALGATIGILTLTAIIGLALACTIAALTTMLR